MWNVRCCCALRHVVLSNAVVECCAHNACRCTVHGVGSRVMRAVTSVLLPQLQQLSSVDLSGAMLRGCGVSCRGCADACACPVLLHRSWRRC